MSFISSFIYYIFIFIYVSGSDAPLVDQLENILKAMENLQKECGHITDEITKGRASVTMANMDISATERALDEAEQSLKYDRLGLYTREGYKWLTVIVVHS